MSMQFIIVHTAHMDIKKTCNNFNEIFMGAFTRQLSEYKTLQRCRVLF